MVLLYQCPWGGVKFRVCEIWAWLTPLTGPFETDARMGMIATLLGRSLPPLVGTDACQVLLCYRCLKYAHRGFSSVELVREQDDAGLWE